MPEPGTPTDGPELLRRIGELEARITRLERRLEPAAAGAPRAPEPAQLALIESVTAVPVLGRAVLAIAGAYMLRALTEAHILPPQAGVFAAIAYAVFWLVWAVRLPAGRRAETVVYSLTSALVLGPLLWEATLRLRALSTWNSAAVLLAFTCIGLLVSWRKNLLFVATISVLTAVLTGAVLLIGSRDVVPFLLLLVLIASAVEISACLDHWLNERWLAAAAADLVVLLATYLVSNSRGLPESYAPIPRWVALAAQLALPTIYLSSTLVRILLRGSLFTIFEVAQIAAAFTVAVGGGLRLGNSWIVSIDAALCLGSAAACYAAGTALKGHNSRVLVTVGFVLVLAGLRLALPAGWAAAVASALALGCMLLRTTAFRWQSAGYLLFALGSSGALAQATEALLDAHDLTGSVLPLVGETAVALACFVLAARAGSGRRLNQTILAGAAFWLLAALGAAAIAALYHAVFGPLASHAYCAAGGTTALAGGAVLLAWIGSRWTAWNVMPLVYPAMALGAYRVLLVDLRQDSKMALVVSLLVYGTALLLLPGLMRPRQTPSS
jgi:hypothetical protein